MELLITMEMVGMVGVVMVAEAGDVQEVVLLGVEDEVMVSKVHTMIMLKLHLSKVVVSKVDTMIMLKVHLSKVVVSSWSSDFFALYFWLK